MEDPPAEEGAQPSEEAPAWPLWTPLAVIGLGLATGVALTAVLAGVLEASGVNLDEDEPAFNTAATLLLDLAFVGATLGVLAMISRPRAWQLGFRRGVPLLSAVGLAFIAMLAFFIFAVSYQAIFRPENPQDIVQDLGADQSTGLLIAGALLVIVVAPLAEELFFRGFIYRVLRLRMAFWLAALANGLLFGSVHGELVILPVLAFLGFVLCWAYERSGTLLVPIALHALNNAIAYGATTKEAVPALVVGAATLAACAAAPALMPRRTPSPLPLRSSA